MPLLSFNLAFVMGIVLVFSICLACLLPTGNSKRDPLPAGLIPELAEFHESCDCLTATNRPHARRDGTASWVDRLGVAGQGCGYVDIIIGCVASSNPTRSAGRCSTFSRGDLRSRRQSVSCGPRSGERRYFHLGFCCRRFRPALDSGQDVSAMSIKERTSFAARPSVRLPAVPSLLAEAWRT